MTKTKDNLFPPVGTHLICEFLNCEQEILNSKSYLVDTIRRAVREAGGTLLGIQAHQFDRHGVTAIAMLGESHISIHTWPEWGYAAADIFTCGNKMDPYRSLKVLKRALQAERVMVRMVERGLQAVER